MRTKLGNEMKIITDVEMIWSVIVFFFSAAQIPNKMPIGTENMTENTLIEMDVHSLSPIIVDALTLGSIVLDTPQSQ